MLESLNRKVKRQFMHLGLAFFAIAVVVSSLTGCSTGKTGKSDEEIISELAQKFMVALYTSKEDLAKEICNDTGFETFKSLSSMMTFGTMGANKQLDESVIISKIDVLNVKMISEDRGVATIMSTLGLT